MAATPAREISVVAGTLYGNRGAQAMTETVVGWIRERDPDARFHVFSYYPDADRRLLSGRADHVTVHSATPGALLTRLLVQPLLVALVRRLPGPAAGPLLRRAPADVRALLSSSVLVDVAGVSFVDGRERFLPFNVLTLWPAWVLGVPVVKLPQAVGPFRGRLNRWLAARVLPRLAVVWARGRRTHEHVSSTPALAGVRLGLGDDIAFAHRPEHALTDEPAPGVLQGHLDALDRARAGAGIRAVVGLCPSSVVAARARRAGEPYEAVLVEAVRELAGRGVQVVLFPHATRADDPVGERNNDLPLIRRVAEGVGDSTGPEPLVVDCDLSATAIKAVVKACDAVAVSRFHAMVAALSQAVPVVVIGWSHKYVEVMARFGQAGRVGDHSSLSCGSLVSSIEAVLADAAGVRDTIREALPDVLAGAERPLAGLLADDLGASLAADSWVSATLSPR